jgi:hypothetical protein
MNLISIMGTQFFGPYIFLLTLLREIWLAVSVTSGVGSVSTYTIAKCRPVHEVTPYFDVVVRKFTDLGSYQTDEKSRV